MSDHIDFRILVIDDNPEIHKDFIKILKIDEHDKDKLKDFEQKLFGETSPSKAILPKFEIDSAFQGQEGLALIDKAIHEGQPYALAFVDVRMPPGWDGVETIKHIWKVDATIQIVLCSAFSGYSSEKIVAELGTPDNLVVLKKPFDQYAVCDLSIALTKKWLLAQ
jgi:CheY-like chemotaxis protein